MRYLCSLALFLLTSLPLFAQRPSDQKIVDGYLNKAGDHAALYYAPLEEPISYSTWINHPFWETEDSYLGEVCYDGIVYKNVMMRFNIFSQTLSVVTPQNRVIVVPDVKRIDYFVMNGDRFEPHDGRFWRRVYSVGRMQLWEERVKTKGPDVERDGRSYHAYREAVKYFFSDGKEIIQIKKAKDIAKHFPSHSKQIRKYIRSFNTYDQQDVVREMCFTIDYLKILIPELATAQPQQAENRKEQAAAVTAPSSTIVYNDTVLALLLKDVVYDLPALRVQRQNRAALEDLNYIPSVNALAENQIYELGSANRQTGKKKVTLSGSITNFKTGEPLEGIQVFCQEAGVGTVTGKDGTFSLELPKGLNTVSLKGMDIEDTYRNFMLYTDGIARIDLEEDDHTLEEIVVLSGFMANTASTQVGVEKFKPQLLKNIPLALGEADVMKMIQTLPGIKTVGEASSGYNVRGGASDQNLILFNNATLYNPSHLFGLFSAFNSDMIENAELYKSSIPAQYGGRISSVLNITPKEASNEEWHGAFSLGIVTSKANLEIPVVKNKVSLLLSGRTTYSDWMLGMVPEKSGYKDGKAGFYDVGGVLTYKVNKLHKVNVNGYYSHDRFSFDEFSKYSYTNMNGSVDWHGLLTSRLSANVSLGFDHYDYKNDDMPTDYESSRLSFNIDQFFLKGLFNFKAADRHNMKMGWNAQYYSVHPGKYEPIGEESWIKFDEIQQEKAIETAVFAEDEWEISENLSLTAGLRWSVFNALGEREYNRYESGSLPSMNTVVSTEVAGSGDVIKTYQAPEFRLSARYMINDDMSLKAGFNTMHQYIHKVSNSTIMSPTDIWKLSDANIKPQTGWQVAGGYYYQTPDRVCEMSAEVYYKKMNDYLTYRSSGSILMNHHLETDVIPTEGRAYGIEFQVKKPTGRLNGWISYAYSRTFLRQNDSRTANPVNGGDWFPTEYDRPHEFKFVGNFKFTQRYSLSCNADYSSGRATTIPAGKYYDHELQKVQPYFTQRNGYRMPDYFRMDASFNIEPNHHLTQLTHSSFSIGCYNVLGRKNTYSIYYKVTEEGSLQGYKLSIFGAPIPFVAYNIKF